MTSTQPRTSLLSRLRIAWRAWADTPAGDQPLVPPLLGYPVRRPC
ncbi:MAG TPA: hypothetical protein VFR74_09285 [Jiangellales bacterium]|nr:hypothetical protein [Jiangellales bacterium]